MIVDTSLKGAQFLCSIRDTVYTAASPRQRNTSTRLELDTGSEVNAIQSGLITILSAGFRGMNFEKQASVQF